MRIFLKIFSQKQLSKQVNVVRVILFIAKNVLLPMLTKVCLLSRGNTTQWKENVMPLFGVLCIFISFLIRFFSFYEKTTSHLNGWPLCLIMLMGEKGNVFQCCRILISKSCIGLKVSI